MSSVTPKDIESLVETFESSGWGEMKLSIDGLELFLSKAPGARSSSGVGEIAALTAAPRATIASAPTTPTAAVSSPHGATPEHWITVRAPNLGTFYRSPKPGAPPYVKLGQHVEPTTEVCIIEVMKLFTSVYANVSGFVRQVLIEDSALVEFDQAIFLIEPDA